VKWRKREARVKNKGERFATFALIVVDLPTPKLATRGQRVVEVRFVQRKMIRREADGKTSRRKERAKSRDASERAEKNSRRRAEKRRAEVVRV